MSFPWNPTPSNARPKSGRRYLGHVASGGGVADVMKGVTAPQSRSLTAPCTPPYGLTQGSRRHSSDNITAKPGQQVYDDEPVHRAGGPSCLPSSPYGADRLSPSTLAALNNAGAEINQLCPAAGRDTYPPQQDRYGGSPPPQEHYGGPTEAQYNGAPQQQQQYGGPPPHQQQQQYDGPPQQQQYAWQETDSYRNTPSASHTAADPSVQGLSDYGAQEYISRTPHSPQQQCSSGRATAGHYRIGGACTNIEST